MKKLLVLLSLSVCLIGCSSKDDRFVEVCGSDTCTNYVRHSDIKIQIDEGKYVKITECGGCPTKPGYMHYIYYVRNI